MRRFLKQVVSIALFVSLIIGLFGSANAEDDYVFKTKHYTLTLPGTWIVTPSKDTEGMTYFYKQEIGSFRDGFVMVIETNDIESEDDQSKAKDYYMGVVSGLEKSAVGNKVNCEDIVIDSYPAMFIDYTQSINSTEFKIFGAILLVEKQLIIVTYVNSTADDSEAESAARSIFNTLQYQKEQDGQSTEKEIRFRGLAWGTSFTEAKEKLSELGLWSLSGEYYKTYSVDDIILGDYQGLSFEYKDINIIGNSSHKEISVAGYTTSDVSLYFAYVPVDGKINHKKEESALYGARYEFEPKNREAMVSDLEQKLTSQYGTPAKKTSRTDWMDNKYSYTYWNGANDTQVVLYSMEAKEGSSIYKDEIKICYVWLKGDEMLTEASALEKKAAEDAESQNYGNTNTDGL